MDTGKQLDPTPYIVSLESEHRQLYARMRKTEDAWLQQCEQAGCTIVYSQKRQHVVLTPQIMPLPELDLAPYHAWQETAAMLARAQGKSPTIGTRSSTPPMWLTLDGQRYPLADPPPDYLICKLTHRHTRAARGAKMGADETLAYIQGKIHRAEKALKSSTQRSQKKRIPEQEQRLERLMGEQSAFQRLVTHARQQALLIGVQITSGEAWRITARTTDRRSLSTSISTVAVMPSTPIPTVERAPTRQRQHSAVEQIEFPNIGARVSLYER